VPTFDSSLFVEFRKHLGYYPKEVLANKIYCNRENSSYLKEKGIMLKAKP